MNKAKNLVRWSILMAVATMLLVTVCIASGLQFLVFGLTITASIISIIWIGVLLHAITE